MDHVDHQVHPECPVHKVFREREVNLVSLDRQELQVPVVREVFRGLPARMEHPVTMEKLVHKVS